MNFITGDYDRSTVASTSDFEQLELEVLVPMEGYMLIYVSNEEEQANIAYFDDISITHNHSPVIQENAYYPFGLQHASSYQRSYSLANRMNTFQDQEYEEETGWVKFKWRNHQPELGRFFNVDPLAEDYYYNSPYAFSENDVISAIELEGLEKFRITNYSLIQSQKLKKNVQKKEYVMNRPMPLLQSRAKKQENKDNYTNEINRIISFAGSNGFEDNYMTSRLEENGIEVPDDVRDGETTIKIEVIDPDAEYSTEIVGIFENESGEIEEKKIGTLNESEDQAKINQEKSIRAGVIVLVAIIVELLDKGKPDSSMPTPRTIDL